MSDSAPPGEHEHEGAEPNEGRLQPHEAGPRRPGVVVGDQRGGGGDDAGHGQAQDRPPGEHAVQGVHDEAGTAPQAEQDRREGEKPLPAPAVGDVAYRRRAQDDEEGRRGGDKPNQNLDVGDAGEVRFHGRQRRGDGGPGHDDQRGHREQGQLDGARFGVAGFQRAVRAPCGRSGGPRIPQSCVGMGHEKPCHCALHNTTATGRRLAWRHQLWKLHLGVLGAGAHLGGKRLITTVPGFALLAFGVDARNALFRPR